MSARIRRWTPILGMIGVAAIWLTALAGIRAAGISAIGAEKPQAKNTAAAKKTPTVIPSQIGATMVGEDTCLTCHSNQAEKYNTTPHHRAKDVRTPAAAQGCETCHGPGSKHVEDPQKNGMVDFKKAKPEDVNATCATCHDKGDHANWDGSAHESRGVSCVNCHSVHAFESEKGQLKKATQMQVCQSCHRDKVSKLQQSGHMPVREGKLQCSTCHNIHGSENEKLLRKGTTTAEFCTSCHADKRGPYLWEHPPVADSCVNCHDAHGSTNERMLVAKQPMLCQRCHSNSSHFATTYDMTQLASSPRLFGRGCVNCHPAIHGSNHPAGNRFFR